MSIHGIGLYDYTSPELAFAPGFHSPDRCDKCGAITNPKNLSYDDEYGVVCDYCADKIREQREEEEIQREGRRAA